MEPQKRHLKPITVYLPDDLIERLQKQSAATHESVSTIVRRELLRPRVTGRDQSAPVNLVRT